MRLSLNLRSSSRANRELRALRARAATTTIPGDLPRVYEVAEAIMVAIFAEAILICTAGARRSRGGGRRAAGRSCGIVRMVVYKGKRLAFDNSPT